MTTVAYIYSHDGDEHGIKFAVAMCTESTLRETVRLHLYPDGNDNGEFEPIMAEILDKGSFDFEDGWVVVKRGAEIVEFLIYQLREAKSEERYADEQRYKELQARHAAEEKYHRLRTALVVALGPNAPDIAKAAA
jgi:hypothetical protein